MKPAKINTQLSFQAQASAGHVVNVFKESNIINIWLIIVIIIITTRHHHHYHQ